MPTGAIPTPKNNNPDKKIANNVDSSNPDFNPDSNNADNNNPYFNADNLCKLRLFSKTKLGTKFYVVNFTFQLK